MQECRPRRLPAVNGAAFRQSVCRRKTGDRRGVSGLVRLVLFARDSIRTRHRSGHPAPCDTAWQFILASMLNASSISTCCGGFLYVVHCGTAPLRRIAAHATWEQSWTAGDWRNYLAAGTSPAEAIGESTHTGPPLGTPEFIQRLERDSGSALVAQKGGRPRQAVSDPRQSTLNF